MGNVLKHGGVLILLLLADTAQAQVMGCPAGQALRGVDFVRRSLVCVPVAAPADVETLRGRVALLEAQLAAEVAARQAGDAMVEAQAASLFGHEAQARLEADSLLQEQITAADRTPEAWHEVGAPGEPAFDGGWTNFASGAPTAAFYKDQAGVVRLKGAIKGGKLSTITPVFALPQGYRPAGVVIQPVVGLFNMTAGGVRFTPHAFITPDGGVYLGGGVDRNDVVYLDALTFRAEP